MSSFNEDIVERDYRLRIGAYFSRGWDIFKEFAWGFIVFVLVVVIIAVVLDMLPPPLGSGEEAGGLLPAAYQLFVAPILSAGFYIVALQMARNRPYEFSDFLKGFNRYLPIFLLSIVSTLMILLGTLLLVIPGLYLAVAYMFSVPLLLDKNLGFWAAMETSRRLISKHWFGFFFLIILLTLMNILGFLALIVGLLLTLPLTLCVVVAAYEDIVGLNSAADSII